MSSLGWARAVGELGTGLMQYAARKDALAWEKERQENLLRVRSAEFAKTYDMQQRQVALDEQAQRDTVDYRSKTLANADKQLGLMEQGQKDTAADREANRKNQMAIAAMEAELAQRRIDVQGAGVDAENRRTDMSGAARGMREDPEKGWAYDLSLVRDMLTQSQRSGSLTDTQKEQVDYFVAKMESLTDRLTITPNDPTLLNELSNLEQRVFGILGVEPEQDGIGGIGGNSPLLNRILVDGGARP